MAKVIKGTNKDEKFMVKETGVEVYAGGGNDTIDILCTSGAVVNGEAGNDYISVSKGTGHAVYCGTGDDTVAIWAGAGNANYINTGDSGNNSIRIKGGSNHQITCNMNTKNTINLMAGNGHIVSGSLLEDTLYICNGVSNIDAHLGNGENRATLFEGTNNQITGGEDTDIFNIKGGSGNTFNGMGGKDYLIIHAGEQNKVYGGDGDDRITVWQNAGDNNYLYGGDGNDQFLVRGGNSHLIIDNAGYNVYNLWGGNSHTVKGGNGKDIFNLDGGNGHDIDMGDGANRMTVVSGNNHVIKGGNGNDELYFNGEIGTSVNAGDGSNKIVISGGSTCSFISGDGNDIINITGGAYHSVDAGGGNNTFNISGGNFNTINCTAAGKNTVTIYNGANSVQFASNYNYDSDDTIVIKGGNNHIIRTAGGKDTVTVTGGKGHSIFGGKENVTVYARGGSDYTVQTASDSIDNRIEISGTAMNVTVRQEMHASDSITVKWSGKMGIIKINTAPNLETYGNQDTDRLSIYDVTSDKFHFSQDGNTLLVESSTTTYGNRLEIDGWFSNKNFEGITFAADSTVFSYDYIKSHLAVG